MGGRSKGGYAPVFEADVVGTETPAEDLGIDGISEREDTPYERIV